MSWYEPSAPWVAICTNVYIYSIVHWKVNSKQRYFYFLQLLFLHKVFSVLWNSVISRSSCSITQTARLDWYGACGCLLQSPTTVNRILQVLCQLTVEMGNFQRVPVKAPLTNNQSIAQPSSQSVWARVMVPVYCLWRAFIYQPIMVIGLLLPWYQSLGDSVI